MKLFNHTGTRVVRLALLAGLWGAACTPSNNNTSGAGGAVTTGGAGGSSSNNPSGGAGGAISSQTGGSNSGGTRSGGTGGTNSSPSGGSASGGAASGGTSSAGGASGGASAQGGSSDTGGSSSSSGGAQGGSQTGGSTSTGGSGSGGTTTVSTDACNLATGVVDGCVAVPNPGIFAISDTCSIGLWAKDQASGGGFYAPWCTGTTAAATDAGAACTLTSACSGGSMHISGSYSGSGNGNAGFGTYLQVYADAGVGCPKMDISSFTGVAIDIDATTVPSNTIYFGLSLADGNSAEKTITTVAGTQSLKIPFSSMTKKNPCGTVTGPGVAGIYFSFAWFGDGASHALDVTFSNVGFY